MICNLHLWGAHGGHVEGRSLWKFQNDGVCGRRRPWKRVYEEFLPLPRRVSLQFLSNTTHHEATFLRVPLWGCIFIEVASSYSTTDTGLEDWPGCITRWYSGLSAYRRAHFCVWGERRLPANFSGQRTDCRADANCLQTRILFSFLLVFAGHVGKSNTRMTEPHVKVTGVPSWCHRTQLPTITPLLDSGPQEPSRLSLYESFEKTGTLIMHHLYPIKNVYRNWVYFCKLIFVPLICVFMPVHVKKFLNLWWLYFIYI